MMTIKRSCSYRIMTRAVDADDSPLVGMLAPGAEDYKPCVDRVQLQATLDTYADALALVDT